jgi:beta-xylosidase
MNGWGFNSQNDHSQTYLIEDFTIKASITWFIYDFMNYLVKVVISIEDLTFKSHILDTMIQIVNINNFIDFLDNNNR